MPSVARDRRLGSGFLLSTPGWVSQATTPHNLPSQSAILIRAYCLATSHSPVALGAGTLVGWAKAVLFAMSHATNAAHNIRARPGFEFVRICTGKDLEIPTGLATSNT